LKVYLRRAGVTREDLFTTDATRKAMTFHDLRATGITWCAVRGNDPLKIMQRAGHADFTTTQIYLREAENLNAGFGDVFPPLPPELLARPARARPSGTVSASVSALGVAALAAIRENKPGFVGARGFDLRPPTVSKGAEAFQPVARHHESSGNTNLGVSRTIQPLRLDTQE
jgi:hypothetical protein